MLEIRDLITTHGLIKALKGVSLSAEKGKITCILGPNGAGKTTLMFSIAGILKPKSGSVTLNGTKITGQSAPAILRQGLALVPENRLVFPEMTVMDNLMAGAYLNSNASEVQDDVDRMFIRFPRLKERIDQLAGTLSGGEQQMLAVARALMARPSILLMDEPSVGLAPVIVDQIFDIIAALKDEGLSILLVEQNATKALKIADQFYLLDQGKVTFSGRPDELSGDDVIRRAYLGDAAA